MTTKSVGEGSPEEAAQFVRDNTGYREPPTYTSTYTIEDLRKQLAAAGDHIAKLDKLSHDLAKQLQRSMEQNARLLSELARLTEEKDHE